ncbi:MAG: L-serine ammonia-lyase, iron-sulfur-dependent, subunit alpha, partial [Muricoprocola sp.]
MEYLTIQELVDKAQKEKKSIGAAVLEDQAVQMEQSEEVVFTQMNENLLVMEKAVESGMEPNLRSTSGLTGGDAYKMQQYAKKGGISGSFMTKAMARTCPYPYRFEQIVRRLCLSA